MGRWLTQIGFLVAYTFLYCTLRANICPGFSCLSLIALLLNCAVAVTVLQPNFTFLCSSNQILYFLQLLQTVCVPSLYFVTPSCKIYWASLSFYFTSLTFGNTNFVFSMGARIFHRAYSAPCCFTIFINYYYREELERAHI